MQEKNESVNAPSGGISSRSAEIVVALVLLLIGAVVAFDSRRIGAAWSSDGPQAGYFPFYIGILISISSFVILLQALFGKSGRSGKIFVEWGALKQVLSVLLPAAVYVIGIQLFGLYLASLVYIAAFMVWLGKYGWLKSVIVGGMVSVAGFLMFEVWFQVPLYKGMFNPLGFLGY